MSAAAPGPYGQHQPVGVEPITIARQLAPGEAEAAAQQLFRSRLPLIWAMLGGLAAVAVVAVGLLTGWSLAAIGGTLAFLVVIFGIALAIGLSLARFLNRSSARQSLGRSGVLSVTWDGIGMQVRAENLARAATYGEFRDVRALGGAWVVRLRISSWTSQYLFSFPPDFIPPVVLDRIRAAGVTVR